MIFLYYIKGELIYTLTFLFSLKLKCNFIQKKILFIIKHFSYFKNLFKIFGDLLPSANVNASLDHE